MAEDSISDLKSILCNESGNVELARRFRALFALKAAATDGSDEAVNAIAEGFKDESDLLKHELAYVLGQTGHDLAKERLREVFLDIENQSEIVRHEAAEGLGALGDSNSLDLLVKSRDTDPSEVIRQTCELAVARIEWLKSEASKHERLGQSLYSSVDPAPPLPLDDDKSTIPSDAESDNDALDANAAKYGALLRDQDKPLFERYRAMFRLRDMGTARAVEELALAFDDPSALLRHEVAYVFGQMSDPRSVPALTKVLNNEKEEGMVRHEAAEALGSIASEDVLDLLKSKVNDEERVVRESAVVALDMYEYENSGELEYAT
ncbi:hypothetical protein CANCADRAFT_2947 [Tortispora caseinolytica NRRL Y-17796]|uniref:Deoxyhypusine hydroxylase n=1 Tax=Tortispora caseinolytica NRRL Y-17796 TaxID=767744 RepID=A0A1E4THL6_9ASCO|nr:hypothetical protein CANCADRAFT_2947 [Tortispora caseinolytica NRRL Y-17796]